MNSDLPKKKCKGKSGSERFVLAGQPLNFDLLNFWKWAASDLVDNTWRGVLAEYLVAKALGIKDDGIRDSWGPVDLVSPTGITIQVKSAAFLQAWYQKEFSRISFSIKPRRVFDSATNSFSETPVRVAQVWGFALLKHKDKLTLDPMDLAQWQFFVVSKAFLDDYRRSQESITLESLLNLGIEPVGFSELAEKVERCAKVDSTPFRPGTSR